MSESHDTDDALPVLLAMVAEYCGILAEYWGQCGLAMSRSLVGANPTWVIVSREPSIEPCGATGNGRVDA